VFPSIGPPLEQVHVGDTSTLTGEVVLYYKNYIIHADKIIYHHSTATVEAQGHLQVQGGPNDTVLTASHMAKCTCRTTPRRSTT
jgi:lipopolysaccharide assembly outer membrane protein LptD (OstA)